VPILKAFNSDPQLAIAQPKILDELQSHILNTPEQQGDI
jgi:hypothetical protein